MAVTLRATAMLNNKPFIKSLGDISAAVSALNLQTVGGNKKGKKSTLDLINANEKLGKSFVKSAKSAEANTKAQSRGAKVAKDVQLTTEATAKSLDDVSRASRRVADAYAKMTPLQARHATATRDLGIARHANALAVTELQAQAAQGLEGPALQKYADKAEQTQRTVQRAAERVGQARQALIAADQKAADQEARRAEAAERRAQRQLEVDRKRQQRAEAVAATEKKKAEALEEGHKNAEKQAESIRKLNGAELERTRLLNNRAAAVRSLGAAMAAGDTGRIAAAEARVIGTEQAIRRYDAAQRAAAEASGQLGRSVRTSVGSLAAQRYMFHDLSRQATRFGVGLAALPAISIAAGSAWEYGFAKVVRTSDLKDNLEGNAGRINALRDSLVGMAQAMPSSFGNITEVAMLANQMGIAASETAEFTRAVIMFSESSGVSVDMAATAFGRLKSLVPDVGSDYLGLADSILKVGVNSVATEDEIINITTQISATAAQAGFTSKEMIGLSGALASVRVPPELSRGVITRVFGQIDKAVTAGGTGLDTLARISGRTAEDFKKQWGTQGAAGVLFTDLIRGIHEAGRSASSELESLGITSVRDKPVLLRLANAADSDGNVGGLLTQTMKDAQNGAGETQKQYTIMAETVVGKLKILGNNLMAFFDAAGRSGLGVFGKTLDNISTALRNFTRDIDKPMKLFGALELPWTNAEALGFVGTLAMMGSAASLLTGIGTKVLAGGKAIQQGMAWFSGTSMGSGLMNLFSGGGLAAGLGKGATNMNKFGKAAGVAGAKTAGLRSGVSGLVGLLGGGLGVATTLGVGAGVAALAVLHSKMQENVTEARDLSNSLASIDVTSVASMNRVLAGITTAGPSEFLGWELNSNPFAGGVKGFQQAIDDMIGIRERNQYKIFGWEFDYAPGRWLDEIGMGMGDENAGLKQVDEAIQGLIDSGNVTQAAKAIQTLAGSGERLNEIMTHDGGANIRAYMENLFAANDIEMTSANLDAFTRGSLKELEVALTGLEGGDKISDMLFGGDIEQMGQFANVIDEAAAAFIDFGGALEAGMQDAEGNPLEKFSLSNYTSELKRSMKAQQEWSDDLVTISEHASTGLLEHLAGLGPAAAPLLAELADELNSGVTTSLDDLEEAFSKRTAGLGNAIAESMANRAWVRKAVGDDGLAGLLMEELGDDKLSQLYEAAEGVGSDTIEAVMQGLARGDINFGEAIDALLKAQPPKAVVNLKADLNLSDVEVTRAGNRAQAALQEIFSRQGIKLEINSETTFGDLSRNLSEKFPELSKMDIDADLSLEDAYASSREFQLWAEGQGIDFLLGADTAPAYLSVAALVAYGRDQDIKLEIEALPEPAEGAIWEIVELADGTRGYVEIDGDNQLAMDSITVVDAETQETRTIPLNGENAEAIQKVLDVRTEAETKPAKISVEAQDNASSIIDNIARDRVATIFARVEHSGADHAAAHHLLNRAYGGITEPYAQGGVREDHRPQIAPAGAMRLWAEPETGGEAYIPFAKDRRKRAEGILADVANRFGFQLSRNTAQYADGGYYAAQQMSRAMYSSAVVQGRDGNAKVNIGSVEFSQSNQKDQFREFSRTISRVARGL